jgi:hypothetical protein
MEISQKNLAALSREDPCSSTSSTEHFEVSPDAERHGGFSSLRKLVANEWRRRLLHSLIRIFLSDLRKRGTGLCCRGERGFLRSEHKQVNGVFTRTMAKSH